MKKYGVQIIFNVIAILLGTFLLRAVGSSAGKPVRIIIILALLAVLCGGNIIFIKKADSGKSVFEKDYIIDQNTFKNLDKPEDYIEVMKDLKSYSKCGYEAEKIIQQWELFQKKSQTLSTVSFEGGVYDVVNGDVESVMLGNMVMFMKRVAIIQSADKGESVTQHREYLKQIVASNEKILSDYTNLIVEASQMSSDSPTNGEVESLQILTQSIKDYREKIERGDIL